MAIRADELEKAFESWEYFCYDDKDKFLPSRGVYFLVMNLAASWGLRLKNALLLKSRLKLKHYPRAFPSKLLGLFVKQNLQLQSTSLSRLLLQ